MNTKTFHAFRKIVYDKAGINISDNKVALVTARVGKRMRDLHIDNDAEYLDYVVHENTGTELVKLLDAISTNVTSFYREESHFELLTALLTRRLGEGMRKLRIWCAASSSGEEPYTLGITLLETLGPKFDMRLLATDISTQVLAKASAGVYSAVKLEPVAHRLRERYFFRRDDGNFEVRPELRALVSFARLNLAEPPFPMSGPFDVVFCRNVMIYFDNIVRKALLQEVHRLLTPGGYLFVGHAESLAGILGGFKSVQPSVYIKE